MKKLLIIALAVLAAAGLGLAVAAHYQKTKVQPEPTISLRAADRQLKDAKAAAGAETKAWIERYNSAAIECQKGAAAYDKLTAFAKTQAARPACPQPAGAQ